jgi:uncharacterized membrane protein YcfT
VTEGLSELHRDFGALQAEVSNLKTEVAGLRQVVAELTAVLNQAKGAKWAIFVLPALVSGVVAVAAYFGLKLTFGSPVP